MNVMVEELQVNAAQTKLKQRMEKGEKNRFEEWKKKISKGLRRE